MRQLCRFHSLWGAWTRLPQMRGAARGTTLSRVADDQAEDWTALSAAAGLDHSSSCVSLDRHRLVTG